MAKKKSQSPVNDNKGRAYRKCVGECGWWAWDDYDGIFEDNPFCDCNIPSREEYRGRGPYIFIYVCALSQCKYKEAV